MSLENGVAFGGKRSWGMTGWKVGLVVRICAAESSAVFVTAGSFRKVWGIQGCRGVLRFSREVVFGQVPKGETGHMFG